MPHRSSRGVHTLLSDLRVDYPHPDDSPQESLVRISWLLSPEPLKFFMAEESLHPKIVVHPKSLELLGQGEVSKDHVMNLGRNKSVFNQKETRFVTTTCCPDG